MPRPVPWALTFHVVLLLQLDPTEVGDSPQGDVEALGHAHLKAIEAHLELGGDKCEPGGPGDSTGSTWHSWSPGSGSCCPAKAWGWTGRSGSDPGLTCCRSCCWREARETRTLRQCVSWLSRLMEQASRPRRLSGGGGPAARQTSEIPSSPPLWEVHPAGSDVGVRGAPNPPPTSWVPPLSPCSVREARTCSSREQPPWGAHFIAVESVRAPRTDGAMDAGSGRQKLFSMFPGEGEGGRMPRGFLTAGEASWWVGQWGEHGASPLGRVLTPFPVQSGNQCPSEGWPTPKPSSRCPSAPGVGPRSVRQAALGCRNGANSLGRLKWPESAGQSRRDERRVGRNSGEHPSC